MTIKSQSVADLIMDLRVPVYSTGFCMSKRGILLDSRNALSCCEQWVVCRAYTKRQEPFQISSEVFHGDGS